MKFFPPGVAILVGLILLGCSQTRSSSENQWPSARGDAEEGMPFGIITDANIEQLRKYAASLGIDLNAEMKLVYERDKDAMQRFLKFSLVFSRLDTNARTYGQLLYSSFLSLGEAEGYDFISAVISAAPNVQQRIRDFLYYETACLPEEQREKADQELRKTVPRLFPADYQFARSDRVFSTSSND